jgi:hypothetical protein
LLSSAQQVIAKHFTGSQEVHRAPWTGDLFGFVRKRHHGSNEPRKLSPA